MVDRGDQRLEAGLAGALSRALQDPDQLIADPGRAPDRGRDAAGSGEDHGALHDGLRLARGLGRLAPALEGAQGDDAEGASVDAEQAGGLVEMVGGFIWRRSLLKKKIAAFTCAEQVFESGQVVKVAGQPPQTFPTICCTAWLTAAATAFSIMICCCRVSSSPSIASPM